MEATISIADDSIKHIRKIMNEFAPGSIGIGDPRIDAGLTQLLNQETSDQPIYAIMFSNRLIREKIQTNPELSKKIYKHIIQQALLLNETTRILESK